MRGAFDEALEAAIRELEENVVDRVLAEVQVGPERRAAMKAEILRKHREEGLPLPLAVDGVILFGLPTDVPREKVGLRALIS